MGNAIVKCLQCNSNLEKKTDSVHDQNTRDIIEKALMAAEIKKNEQNLKKNRQHLKTSFRHVLKSL